MQEMMRWLKARMADSQLMVLLASLLIIFTALMLLGNVLAVLFVAIAFAYVLDDVVHLLERAQMPRLAAIGLVGAGALLLVLFTLLAIFPLLAEQVVQLASNLPRYISELKAFLLQLHAEYALWLNLEYVRQIVASTAGTVQNWGGALLSFSVASIIPGVITLLIYAVLVPVLVFFLLKDKALIINWAKHFMPEERTLLHRVWNEVDVQIGNYIRGKFWECVVVGAAMWVAYALMGHQYALLLGVLTGISVWVPFVGAAVVTIPVVLLSFMQWGWSDTALYGLLIYTIIQAIDANVLVPWLFSEVVNLHPVAIVVAILVFGHFWGVLGVFIAIPMASLVQSVLTIIVERKPVREGGSD